MRLAGKAVADFSMIEGGDKIMVCMSGGKDSYVLLDVLMKLQKRAPVPFELIAVHVDQHLPNFPKEVIPNYLKQIGVPYHIEDQDTWSIVQRVIPEGQNVCSVCSRLRRGIIYRVAKELGVTKIALGHHSDDAAETFLMNLFSGGRAECFSPVSYLSRKDLYMIRPMIFCGEKDIERVVKKENIPVVKSRCPADGSTHREETKELIRELEKKYPDLKNKLTGALERGSISGWHI